MPNSAPASIPRLVWRLREMSLVLLTNRVTSSFASISRPSSARVSGRWTYWIGYGFCPSSPSAAYAAAAERVSAALSERPPSQLKRRTFYLLAWGDRDRAGHRSLMTKATLILAGRRPDAQIFSGSGAFLRAREPM